MRPQERVEGGVLRILRSTAQLDAKRNTRFRRFLNRISNVAGIGLVS